MQFLKADLEDADSEVEELENQLLQYRESDGIYLSESEVIKKIKLILKDCLHNLIITAPTILELDKFDIYELPPSIAIKAACEIDISNPAHQELYSDLGSFDNISLKQYSDKDRYCVLRDGEELLFAALGEDPEKILTFRTKDPKKINIFNSLVMESWLRSKKV